MIKKRLQEIIPDIPVVAEESFDPAKSNGSAPSRFILVDPLDGTPNYASGIPFACVSVAVRDADGGLAGAVDVMRRRAERAIAAGLPPREEALVLGMVLGQDERISANERDDWRAAGLAHLLAVSGQNVMLLAALALPALDMRLGEGSGAMAAVPLISPACGGVAAVATFAEWFGE